MLKMTIVTIIHSRAFTSEKKTSFFFNVVQGCQMVCFQTKIPKLGKKFQSLRLENVDIFSGHFGIFYEYLGYFMTIRYISCSFGSIFLVLVSCTKKNLATLMSSTERESNQNKLHLMSMPQGFYFLLFIAGTATQAAPLSFLCLRATGKKHHFKSNLSNI
jgi:hypothetical protein